MFFSRHPKTSNATQGVPRAMQHLKELLVDMDLSESSVDRVCDLTHGRNPKSYGDVVEFSGQEIRGLAKSGELHTKDGSTVQDLDEVIRLASMAVMKSLLPEKDGPKPTEPPKPTESSSTANLNSIPTILFGSFMDVDDKMREMRVTQESRNAVIVATLEREPKTVDDVMCISAAQFIRLAALGEIEVEDGFKLREPKEIVESIVDTIDNNVRLLKEIGETPGGHPDIQLPEMLERMFGSDDDEDEDDEQAADRDSYRMTVDKQSGVVLAFEKIETDKDGVPL